VIVGLFDLMSGSCSKVVTSFIFINTDTVAEFDKGGGWQSEPGRQTCTGHIS